MGEGKVREGERGLGERLGEGRGEVYVSSVSPSALPSGMFRKKPRVCQEAVPCCSSCLLSSWVLTLNCHLAYDGLGRGQGREREGGNSEEGQGCLGRRRRREKGRGRLGDGERGWGSCGGEKIREREK